VHNNLRSLALFLFVLFVVATACHDGLTAPVTVHGTVTSIESPAPRCLFTCDPPSVGYTLTLVNTVNNGSVTSYVQTCGSRPAYAEQELIGGRWVNVNPAATCVEGSGSMALAPGDSVQMNWLFPAGRRRIVLPVAGKADLSDLSLDASAEMKFP